MAGTTIFEYAAVTSVSALLIFWAVILLLGYFTRAAAAMGLALFAGQLFWYTGFGVELGGWSLLFVVTLFAGIPLLLYGGARPRYRPGTAPGPRGLGNRASLAYIAGHDKRDPHHRRRNGRVGGRLAGGQPRHSRGYSRNAPAGGYLRAPDG